MAIVEEGMEIGRLMEARKMILLLGCQRLGAPDEAIKTSLDNINSLECLEELFDRVLEVHSWEELLGMA